MKEFPTGAITAAEEPDFLVDTPRGSLGIELTEWHRAVPPGVLPPQASEAMRQRVVGRAQQLYIAGGHVPIRCTVLMRDRHIHKDEVQSLAEAIVRIAIKNLPAPKTSVQEEYDWLNRAHFPEIVQSVTVSRLEGITGTHFSCGQSAWVAPLTAIEIERVITAKEGKYLAYRRRCEEAWLLIIADTFYTSTWIEFDSPALTASFESPFQRVFVMRLFAKVLHELTVVPKGSA